jgi:hypothetical protein
LRNDARLAIPEHRLRGCRDERRGVGVKSRCSAAARCIMAHPDRKIAFVPASSDHGTMIVNRFAYHVIDLNPGFGVGFDVLDGSAI